MNRALSCICLLLAFAVRTASAQTNVSLEQCIEYALTNSPEHRKTVLALQNRRLDTIIEKARFDIGLKASAQHDPENDTSSGSVQVNKEIIAGFDLSSSVSMTDADTDDDDSASWSITLSKLLIGGGSLRESMLNIDNSVLGELIAANNVSRSARELKHRITQDYYRVIRNTQSLAVRELKLAAARKNLEHATERENPLDIATAGIEVPENEAAVLSARNDIAASLDDLREMMGMDIRQPLAIGPEFEFREEDVSPTNDLLYCLKNHEDVLNLGLEREQLQNQIGVQGVRVWPRVSLSGSASQGGEGSLDFDGETEYTMGLSLAWDLGARAERASARKLGNDLLAMDLSLRALRIKKENAIFNLARRLDQARKLLRLQEERVKFSTRRVELYTYLWENGEIDILEYIRSQNDLQDSKIQLINQKTSYMDLLSQYHFEVGR